MKLTKRKGFNFFRSYYDVYNELSDKDKIQFIDALLDRQFLGVKPNNLKGMAKFAYISQTNSIDSQVKGYEDKTKSKLSNTPTLPPTVPPCYGGQTPPTLQVEEKGKEKEKDIYRAFKHLSISKSEVKKLGKNWSKIKIDEILDNIENFANNKKYVSLYLTANTWLKKQYPIKQQAKDMTDLEQWEEAQKKLEIIKTQQ